MLIELAIQDLALIERASLGFDGGLNVITGETGAGKSLLIDALELLLGQRPRAGMVRAGASRARVEGRFVLVDGGYGEQVARWLKEHLPDTYEECESERGEGPLELILTRTIGADNRSRAHINHRPVTQRMLRELASQLVEIHGQNDHQKLFEPLEQLRLLDTFGNLHGALATYREGRERWLDLARRVESHRSGESERLQRLDLLRFQASELSTAEPTLQAFDDLASERTVLAHASDLQAELGGYLVELTEADNAALDVLRRGERLLDHWASRVSDLGDASAEMREAVAHIEEAAATLSSFVGALETNATRLEDIEGRLALLDQLRRKYGVDNEGLTERLSSIREELAGLESEDIGLDALIEQTDLARRDLEGAAARLDDKRKRLRSRLQKAVQRSLKDLGLPHAKFAVSVQPPKGAVDAGDIEKQKAHFTPWGVSGFEFLLAANPGEEGQPLRKVASGGEAARIMLALRGALAVRQSTPTLIFDEVDAGVGGRLGPEVGAHLAQLGDHHQILCVTHLPAIAACATRHLRVHKEIEKGRTRTIVQLLEGEKRVQEVADMISGGSAHATARAEAQRLIESAES